MRYNPNPTFLTRAVKIRKNRHTRIVITVVVAVLVALIVLFVNWGARMQETYRQLYPDMVGAATATTTESSNSDSDETSENTETVSTEETVPPETSPAPVVRETTTVSTEATESTAQVNTPDVFEEQENMYFRNSYPLQTISHEQRDMSLDVLKQNILDYCSGNPGYKISFSYINLRCGETMNINDLEPIVPGGAWALPLAIIYDESCARGIGSFQRVVTYSGDNPAGNASYIAATYTGGKQFYMRSILNLAVANNDNLAMQYVMTALGGNNSAWKKIASISSYINFTENVIYTDYTGVQQRGNYRTSAYDMGNYLKYLYYSFINTPDVYQTLINDLYYSQMPSPYNTVFSDANVFHICGRNETTHSYMDAAIIDGDEPIILVISVECPSYDQAQVAMADLSTYLERYISSCHEA